MDNEPRWIDIAISWLLRGGVLLSVFTVLVGLIVSFRHHPDYFSSQTALGLLTHSKLDYPNSIPTVLHGVGEGRGQAIVMLGLLLLIATPVARVAFSIVMFAIERDRLYAVITAGVLLILMISFWLGAAGG